MKIIKKQIQTKKVLTIGQIAVSRLKKDPEYSVDKLAQEIKKVYPKSKWSKSHHTWYKSALKAGRLNKIVKSL